MLRLGIGVTGPFKHNPLHLSIISKDEACIFHKRSSSQAAQNLITGFHICTHGYNRTGHPSLPSHYVLGADCLVTIMHFLVSSLSASLKSYYGTEPMRQADKQAAFFAARDLMVP